MTEAKTSLGKMNVVIRKGMTFLNINDVTVDWKLDTPYSICRRLNKIYAKCTVGDEGRKARYFDGIEPVVPPISLMKEFYVNTGNLKDACPHFELKAFGPKTKGETCHHPISAVMKPGDQLTICLD